MSKAYGKTSTFRTNFDFMTSAEKNFVFIATKQGNFYNCRSCGLIKNNTCMVNRQRQSKFTMIQKLLGFLDLRVYCKLLSRRSPKCSPHHVFVILSLVTMLKVK